MSLLDITKVGALAARGADKFRAIRAESWRDNKIYVCWIHFRSGSPNALLVSLVPKGLKKDVKFDEDAFIKIGEYTENGSPDYVRDDIFHHFGMEYKGAA